MLKSLFYINIIFVSIFFYYINAVHILCLQDTEGFCFIYSCYNENDELVYPPYVSLSTISKECLPVTCIHQVVYSYDVSFNFFMIIISSDFF